MITKEDISKIMVNNKQKFPLIKGDVSIMVVDIPKAAEEIFKLIDSKKDCTVYLSDERRLDMLTGAIEGGSNYWYFLPDVSMCDKYRKSKSEPLVDRMMKAILVHEIIPVHDIENLEDFLGNISLSSIIKGEELMFKNHPKDFADILDENDDAETADIWFQLCVLGEIVYG